MQPVGDHRIDVGQRGRQILRPHLLAHGDPRPLRWQTSPHAPGPPRGGWRHTEAVQRWRVESRRWRPASRSILAERSCARETRRRRRSLQSDPAAALDVRTLREERTRSACSAPAAHVSSPRGSPDTFDLGPYTCVHAHVASPRSTITDRRPPLYGRQDHAKIHIPRFWGRLKFCS